jgi:hypothetical protein
MEPLETIEEKELPEKQENGEPEKVKPKRCPPPGGNTMQERQNAILHSLNAIHLNQGMRPPGPPEKQENGEPEKVKPKWCPPPGGNTMQESRNSILHSLNAIHLNQGMRPPGPPPALKPKPEMVRTHEGKMKAAPPPRPT